MTATCPSVTSTNGVTYAWLFFFLLITRIKFLQRVCDFTAVDKRSFATVVKQIVHLVIFVLTYGVVLFVLHFAFSLIVTGSIYTSFDIIDPFILYIYILNKYYFLTMIISNKKTYKHIAKKATRQNMTATCPSVTSTDGVTYAWLFFFLLITRIKFLQRVCDFAAVDKRSFATAVKQTVHLVIFVFNIWCCFCLSSILHLAWS